MQTLSDARLAAVGVTIDASVVGCAGSVAACMRLVEQRHPSLELALDVLARIRAEAAERGLALAACVVDAAGHIVASQRMDGAALGATRLAAGKAYTAVLWGARTGEFMESTQPGGVDWGFNSTDSRIVVYAGGVPLRIDGQLIGAAAASGGTGEEDEACVTAAIRSLGFDEDT